MYSRAMAPSSKMRQAGPVRQGRFLLAKVASPPVPLSPTRSLMHWEELLAAFVGKRNRLRGGSEPWYVPELAARSG